MIIIIIKYNKIPKDFWISKQNFNIMLWTQYRNILYRCPCIVMCIVLPDSCQYTPITTNDGWMYDSNTGICVWTLENHIIHHKHSHICLVSNMNAEVRWSHCSRGPGLIWHPAHVQQGDNVCGLSYGNNRVKNDFGIANLTRQRTELWVHLWKKKKKQENGMEHLVMDRKRLALISWWMRRLIWLDILDWSDIFMTALEILWQAQRQKRGMREPAERTLLQRCSSLTTTEPGWTVSVGLTGFHSVPQITLLSPSCVLFTLSAHVI